MKKKIRFGDLETGDVILANLRKWTLNPIKIVKVEIAPSCYGEIWIYLENNSSFHVSKTKNYYGGLLGGCWVDYEEAIKDMMERARRQEKIYIENIDALVSEYERLEKFIEKYEGC